MKFKFSLDSVLKVRSHQKKLEKQKLAEEVAERNKINQLQMEVQNKLQDYLKNAEDMKVQDMQTVRRHTAHIEQVHQQMSRLNEELNAADEKITNARQKLEAAHKNLHIIEKVKEFEHEIHLGKLSREEQKFLDEIATQSFKR